MSESTDNVIIGPVFPPNYCQSATDVDDEKKLANSISNRENVTDETATSVTKKDFRKEEETENNIIGPVLPEDWKPSGSSSKSLKNDAYGPALPPGYKQEVIKEDSDDEDDDIIGPLPSEATVCSSNYDIVSDIERRAKKMKDHLEGKDKQNVTPSAREEWMIQLPDVLGPKIGIVSRTFHQNTMKKDEDRSVWTDTPADVERKGKVKPLKKTTPDLKEYASQERDQRMFEQIEEYNKTKRPESLLEIHRKNRKRKAMEDTGPKERRPFDRDIDLSVSHCNPSQTKTILDKAKFLNSRFSHGSSHFL